MKVYVRAPYPENKLKELEEMFDDLVYDPWTKTGERFYEDEMLEKLLSEKPDVLITELDRITEKVLTGYNGLKIIGDCRSNPANIDVSACSKHNIPILCTPGRNSTAVAEYVVGILLMKYRHLDKSIDWVKDGEWKEGTTPYYTWMGDEISNKKVGLVGFGAVGREIAKRLDVFGAEVSFYDPYVEKCGKYIKKDLTDIFKDSDIISLHLPVNSETTNMIDKDLLDLIKPKSVLINSARSKVVNNDDLMKLIEDKDVEVILDVLPEEPPKRSDIEFLKNKNVTLTPHIAGATYQVTNHQADILNESIKKYYKNENLEKIVYNKEIL